jgi:6,7-dimethyl-8-ribityllumazine synthase
VKRGFSSKGDDMTAKQKQLPQLKIKAGQGKGKRFGIVVAKFNEFITKRLFKACLDELKRYGVSEKNLTIVWVPGSFEIPVTALHLANKKNIDAVICLGAVIRGETLHFDLVAKAAADGVAQVALLTKKPVIFGVITTETVNQAYKRSQEKGDNKGRDAAQAAIEMTNLLAKI